jgi:hypothetical protein
LYAIWAVPVFPAKLNHSTYPFLAAQALTQFTNIFVITFEVDSLRTLLSDSDLYSITLPSANSTFSIIFGVLYTQPFASTLYAAAICNGVTLIPNQYELVYKCDLDHFCQSFILAETSHSKVIHVTLSNQYFLK